jgi:hypothetical protein
VGYVACTGEKTNAYRVFVGKSEGKSQLGRLRIRLDDSVKIDLNEIRWEAVD